MAEYIEREALLKVLRGSAVARYPASFAMGLFADADEVSKQSAYNVVEAGNRDACDYCQKFDDPCGVPMIAIEEDDCDRGIYLYNGYLCANGGSFCEAKVEFCPMCGRRLDGE